LIRANFKNTGEIKTVTHDSSGYTSADDFFEDLSWKDIFYFFF
jgi:hypothetical protein